MEYIGNELELFQYAVNWKKYFGNYLKPFLKGDVCEVGAGLGGTTKELINENVNLWLAIEPDAKLASEIHQMINKVEHQSKVQVVCGTLADVSVEVVFDAVIYIDVMEHIEFDRQEFELAANHLKKGGKLIILVPAFNFLYNSFDKAIGHFRRYDKPMLKSLNAGNVLRPVSMNYFDSMGFFASVANKLFIKRSDITRGNVDMWDSYLIPVSRVIDPILFRTFGKTLIGVWEKP
jgi:2-polyprenyl-3-methyl-5-hydroxy-6-metoxy-1,4-benzoquinol methylase